MRISTVFNNIMSQNKLTAIEPFLSPLTHNICVFTARQRSFGKVMFSQVFVCSQGISGARPLPGNWSHVLLDGVRYFWSHVPQKGHGTRYTLTPSPGTTKAGSTHPTCMLSCSQYQPLCQNLNIVLMVMQTQIQYTYVSITTDAVKF